jgi:hypothetical protein
MRTIRSRAATGAVIAALMLSPALASCGMAAEEAAEQLAEQAIGGGDVEVNDGEVTITDDEGNAVAVGEDVAVPDTWPSEVPLFDGGTLQMVSVTNDGSATAMWLVEGSAADAAAAYGASLEAAGYTVDTESNMGGMVVNSYKGSGFTVSMQSIASDESQTTLMVVAEKSG